MVAHRRTIATLTPAALAAALPSVRSTCAASRSSVPTPAILTLGDTFALLISVSLSLRCSRIFGFGFGCIGERISDTPIVARIGRGRKREPARLMSDNAGIAQDASS